MKYYKFWSNIYKFLPLPWPKYDSQHFTPYHKLNYILLGFFISSFLLSIKKKMSRHTGRGGGLCYVLFEWPLTGLSDVFATYLTINEGILQKDI